VQPPRISSFFGKAHPPGSDPSSVQWHPLDYHCQDVSAVCTVYLQKNPSVLRYLASSLETDVTTALNFLSFVAAVHDTGKFDTVFQAKRPDLLKLLLPGEPLPTLASKRNHAQAGAALLLEPLAEAWAPKLSLPPPMVRRLLSPFVHATCYHHGHPEKTPTEPEYFPRVTRVAVGQFVVGLLRQFNLEAPPDFLSKPDAIRRLKRVAYVVAGLVSVADWVGAPITRTPTATKGANSAKKERK
jgi:CRISPR-associated endonuclease/helicase Cas3